MDIILMDSVNIKYEYIITFGKHEGKKLSELNFKQLRGLYGYIVKCCNDCDKGGSDYPCGKCGVFMGRVYAEMMKPRLK